MQWSGLDAMPVEVPVLCSLATAIRGDRVRKRYRQLASRESFSFPSMRAPQLRLSLVVSAQKGARGVPHCVVPPVHVKMHVPMLQMVMAEGSVGHTLPHLPLRAHMNSSYQL